MDTILNFNLEQVLMGPQRGLLLLLLNILFDLFQIKNNKDNLRKKVIYSKIFSFSKRKSINHTVSLQFWMLDVLQPVVNDFMMAGRTDDDYRRWTNAVPFMKF